MIKLFGPPREKIILEVQKAGNIIMSISILVPFIYFSQEMAMRLTKSISSSGMLPKFSPSAIRVLERVHEAA